jgi:hypothetical protein
VKYQIFKETLSPENNGWKLVLYLLYPPTLDPRSLRSLNLRGGLRDW